MVDKTVGKTSQFKRDDKVIGMPVTGVNPEYICLPEKNLITISDNIPADEAACLVLTYTTAYQLLHKIAKVNKNDKIFIHGADGAIDTAMIQLGQLAGLEM